MRLSLSWEQMTIEKRMRSKMIEMSGDTPKDRGRESVYDEYKNLVSERVRAATFTGKGDGEIVVSLYGDYYDKLQNATSRAQRYASTREDVKCDLYTGPASDLLEKMTCSGYCYRPCCPCVCCVLIGVKEYGFGDSNQYADTPAEVTWRGVDPDGALPQAQEMSRD